MHCMESVDDDVIRHVVQRCKHLENISLNLCERVSEIGVEALSVALKSGLKDLSIVGCNVTNRGKNGEKCISNVAYVEKY